MLPRYHPWYLGIIYGLNYNSNQTNNMYSDFISDFAAVCLEEPFTVYTVKLGLT
jgi:hypothetical protein